ncbi:MAG: glycosyltransferase family 4 protein [Actinobacteria bacterium]|nr:glycosyltransferase family 4 protein [Actinomycetota bacterium]
MIIALRPFIRPLKSNKNIPKKENELKIIHYTECQWIGGVVTFIIRLIPFFNHKGFRQVLIIRNDGDNIQGFDFRIKHLKNNSLKVIRINPLIDFRDFSLLKILKLTTIFRKLDADLLHIHKANWYRDKTAILAAQLAGTPNIVTHEMCGGKPGNSRFLNWLKGLRDRNISDITIINAWDMKKHLTEVFDFAENQIVYVPNCIDADESNILNGDRKKFMGKYKLSDEDTLIGVSGRLVPEKGLQYLLESMSYILTKYPQTKILLTGEGFYKDKLISICQKGNIKDKVVFLGYIKESKLILFYKLLKIGILPSLHEGMPGSVLEYMAAGLPVVATAVNGTKDLVIDGVTGLLVPPKDPVSLAKAINKLLEKPEMAEEMGRNGKERVEKEFSVEIVGEKINKLYLNLINR